MNRKQHKLIYEFSGSRNLNTNPLDVTGLDGDTWDYFVEIEMSLQSAVSNAVFMTCNSDTGSNYRYYSMAGRVSTAAASVNDSSSTGALICFTDNTTTTAIGRMSVSGYSSEERYLDGISGGDWTTGTEVEKTSHYWKNNVDNLTQLSFSSTGNVTADITLRIYQVPKQANLANYDLMEVKSATGDLSLSPENFTGLDGDSDAEYLIDIEGTSGDYVLRYNDDATSNYVCQKLYNSNGSILSENATRTGVNVDAGQIHHVFKIDAVSGRKRLTTLSSSQNANQQQNELACLWGNEVDNLSKITVVSLFGGTETYEIKLYRRKSNKSIDPVPMMTVAEIPVSGDFSAGVTISGIEGDRIDGAIKVEFVGQSSASASNLYMQLNGDTGFNYSRQLLYGLSSTAGAGSAGAAGFITLTGLDLDDTTDCEHWLYPKSGQNRPAIQKNSPSGTEINLYAFWWNNTADELSSMKIYASNSNLLTCTIRISVPEGTKQATGSFAVTIN